MRVALIALIALAGCGTIGVERRGTLEQVEADPFRNVGGEWHGQFEQSDPTEFTFKLPKVTF